MRGHGLNARCRAVRYSPDTAITLFASLGDPARHDHTGAQLMAAWLEFDLGRSSAAGIRARAVLDEYGNEGEGDTELDNIPARRGAEARALLDYLD
ncbi:hypothetical protein [Streptomyces tubercidicus]|uniref:hypothetical protein n=1 Tax=Streptomyces tubercidicus TaxID=47759 RepID=UPI0034665BE2